MHLFFEASCILIILLWVSIIDRQNLVISCTCSMLATALNHSHILEYVFLKFSDFLMRNDLAKIQHHRVHIMIIIIIIIIMQKIEIELSLIVQKIMSEGFKHASYAIVSASTPLIQGAFVVGGPCQVLEHSSCRGPSAFPPCQGVAAVAAACLRLQWVSVLICSYRAERTGENSAGCL